MEVDNSGVTLPVTLGHITENITDTEEETDKYQEIIDRIQLSMTTIGFIGNVISYITLHRNGNTFTSPTVLRLLKNQSFVDSLVCLVGSIFVSQPAMWTTNNYTFSYFVCQVRTLFQNLTAFCPSATPLPSKQYLDL